MRSFKAPFNILAIATGALASVLFLTAKMPEPIAPVQMTVTLETVGEGKRTPVVNREDVMVKQGKDRLNVTGWGPATGDRAGLDLFILIDDASDSALGLQLEDLREFIANQPATTSIGVGYIRNATVDIAQNFTTDHGAAAKALRLPTGSMGAYGNPYLSVVDLMKRWPEHPNRREVIMVTDGIDRRGGGTRSRGFGPISPDVDYASSVAQRTGTMIHTIFYPGAGHLHHNFWLMNNGQIGIAKLSEETGGESFFLGRQAPVSFKPYLDQLEDILKNQYILTFEAKPGKKAGLQSITLTTEVAGVDFAAADGVWVPAAK